MVILFDQFHLPKDILDVVFATDQQVVVARMLINEIKRNGGSMGKTEMSVFAKQLHSGTTIEMNSKADPEKTKKISLSYNKRQFYDRILTPMKSMGLVDYDLYKKRYTLSDRFNTALKDVGSMWIEELKRKEVDKK
jgi:hypothetical protein